MNRDDIARTARRIFIGLLLATIVGAGLTVAMARTPDPMGTACEANAQLLPKVIPTLVVLNVTDEDGRRVPPALEPRIRAEIETALSHFPFKDSIAFVMNDTELSSYAVRADVHIATLQLWINADVPTRWFENTAGRMCGNVLLAKEGDDPVSNIWTQKHELGHYFGLPHYEGTFMNGRGDRSHESNLLVACQHEILSKWIPGDPYVPHWTHSNRGECAEARGFWERVYPFS